MSEQQRRGSKQVFINSFEGGLVTDIDNINRKKNTFQDARNIDLLDDDGQGLIAVTAKGVKEFFQITAGFTPRGSYYINGILYIISHNLLSGESEIGCFPSPVSWDKDNTAFERVYKPLNNYTGATKDPAMRGPMRNNHFNLGDDYVDVRGKQIYDGSINLYFADGVNPLRVINTGFNQMGGQTSKIYYAGDFNHVINVIRGAENPPLLDFVELQEGGQWKSGNTFFYIRYLTEEYNKTSFIAESAPIAVSNYPGHTGISGEPGSTGADDRSTKAIRLNLQNLDENYKFYELAYIRFYSDNNGVLTNECRIINNYYPIESQNEWVTITGYEESANFDLDKLIKPNVQEDICRSIEIADNRLWGANWKRNKKHDDVLSLFASRIRILPTKTSKTIVDDKFYVDPEKIQEVGYFRGETYAFQVNYVFNDSSETLSYPIWGIDMFDETRLDLISAEPDGVYIDSYTQEHKGNKKGIIRMPNNIPRWEAKTVDGVTSLHINILGVKFDTSMAEAAYSLPDNVIGFYFSRAKRIPNLKIQGVAVNGCVSSMLESNVTSYQDLMIHEGQSGTADDYREDAYYMQAEEYVNEMPSTPEEVYWGIKKNQNKTTERTINDYDIKEGIIKKVMPIYKGYYPGINYHDGRYWKVFMARSFYATNFFGVFSPDYMLDQTIKINNGVIYDLGKINFSDNYGESVADVNGSNLIEQPTTINGTLYMEATGSPISISLKITSKEMVQGGPMGNIPQYSSIILSYVEGNNILTIEELINEIKNVLQSNKVFITSGPNYISSYSIEIISFSNIILKAGISDVAGGVSKGHYPFNEEVQIDFLKNEGIEDPVYASSIRPRRLDNVEMDMTPSRSNIFVSKYKDAGMEVGGEGASGNEAMSYAIESSDGKLWVWSNRSMVTPRYLGIEFDGVEKDLNLHLVNVYSHDPKESTYDIEKLYNIKTENFYKISRFYKKDELAGRTGTIYNGDCFLQPSFFKIMGHAGSSLQSLNNEFAGDDGGFLERAFQYDDSHPYAKIGHGVLMMFITENAINAEMRIEKDAHSFFPATNSLLNHTVIKAEKGDTAESKIVNHGYNQLVSLKSSKMYNPDLPEVKNVYPTRVRYSNLDIPGSYLDNFSNFDFIGYRDFDVSNGAIKRLMQIRGWLVSICENGALQHYINSSQTQADPDAKNTLMGINEILHKNARQLMAMGSQHFSGIIKTERGIYGIDWRNKAFWMIVLQSGDNGAFLSGQDLSSQKMSKKYISDIIESESGNLIDKTTILPDNPENGTGIIFSYDNGIVYGSILGQNKTTIVFNEKIGLFVGGSDFVPSFAAQMDKNVIAFDNDYQAWRMTDEDNYRATFFGTFFESYVKSIVNPFGIFEKIYDALVLHTPDKNLERIEYETEDQSTSHVFPNAGGASMPWQNPVFKEDKLYVPTFPEEKTFYGQTRHVNLRGTWLSIKVVFKQKSKYFLKNILTTLRISKS